MKMGFAETQPSEREFFRAALAGHELRFVSDANEADIDAEVLSVHLQSRIDAEFLEGRPSLKLIATRSTGHGHIDSAECARRGVVVCNVPGSDANSVAEHAFALMLAVARRLYAVREARKQLRFYYERLRSFDLKGKTLGVIGTGRIGFRVVHIALAFGMHVLAYDPHRRSLMAEIVGTRYVPFDELLRASHVISLHAPLTPETYHLLDRKAFAKCRSGVVIINTARGALIDTKALIEALDAGRVGGAGLDVLEDESVMQKEGARIEWWLKEIAPSTGLRKWFGHDPARWEEFKKRYFAELDGRAALVEELRKRTERGVVTLIYGAKDETHNHAAALKDYLRRRAGVQPGELLPPTFPT
jgi:D-lactate dehydrogenase